MRWNNVKLVFIKEIIDILRDKRTLFIMTILPILLYPVMMIGSIMLMQMQQEKMNSETSVVAVIGAEFAPEVMALIEGPSKKKESNADSDADDPDKSEEDNDQKDGDSKKNNDSEKESRYDRILKNLELKHELSFHDGLKEQLLDKEVGIVIEFPEKFKEILESGSQEDVEALKVKVWFDSNTDKSVMLKDSISNKIEQYKNSVLKGKLDQAKIPIAFLDEGVTLKDVGAEKAVFKGAGGALLAKMLAFMLVTMSLTGAFYPAIDISAGEKERGTMETLLITPIPRVDLVLGKYFTVFTLAVITALLNLGSMGLSFAAIPQMLGEGAAESFSFGTNVLVFVYMIIVLIPLVALFSALSLALSTFARSFKEGQNYLNPLIMMAMVPSMAVMFPGFEMTTTICFIPVLSAALLFRELFANNFELTHILLTFSATFIYSVIAIQWTASLFDREEVLFRESEDINWKFWIKKGLKRSVPSGFEALFVYSIVLVLFFFGSTRVDPKTVTLWQLVGVMLALHYVAVLGVPLLMTKLFNVSWKKTLHLVLPPKWSIIRSLPFIVSSIVLVRTVLVWKMGQGMMSEPEEVQRTDELIGILIKDYFWVALLMIAITPAITEELLCRGFVLSSFERAFGRLACCLDIISNVWFVAYECGAIVECYFVGSCVGHFGFENGFIAASNAHAFSCEWKRCFMCSLWRRPVGMVYESRYRRG